MAQSGQWQRRPRSAAKQLCQSHLFGLAGLIHFIHYSYSLTLISVICLDKLLSWLRMPAQDKPQ
ncbi:hypothetical protein, partial [Enterobacter sp. Lyrl_3]|uniref:hypothetical protein n=1 Tax=Enterobacter sp. Lyrl_3 TaxID=3110922 RepID=UPI003F7F8A4B